MIELELFYSQLSSIMEVLVRSAIADIGKLMEDYTASLLEKSRCRNESEAVKLCTSIQSCQGNTGTPRKEFTVLGQRPKENIKCRSGSDQVATPLDGGHKNKQNPGQTTLHQDCRMWNDQQSSQENYPQQETCVQEHVSTTTVSVKTHLTLKEEHREPLSCRIKEEMQLEDTLLNTVPRTEEGWSEQHQVCSIKLERPSPCIQNSPPGDSIEPYGLSLTQHHLSPLQSIHQMETENQGPNPDLATDLYISTLGSPLPDHFSHGTSYSDYPPNYPLLPTDLHVSAERAAPGLGVPAGHGSEVALAQKPRKPSMLERFACKYCGQGFAYLSQLKRHMPKHTKERPFSCSLCGFRFTRMSHLKRHEKAHTGDRPYACEVCGRSFIRKSHLDQHLKTHRRTALQYSVH
ncbi:zinc finger protein 865-like [Sardina pilchardus]|uniref:zinc finger protein 865-like n=1 Tax=Sardina pilchardus TaxID=27697 RepID=UPI002E1506E3